MTFYQTENGFPFSNFISDTRKGFKQCQTLADYIQVLQIVKLKRIYNVLSILNQWFKPSNAWPMISRIIGYELKA